MSPRSAELHLVLSLHGHALALPARYVSRLVLLDEVTVLHPDAPVIALDGTIWPVWNLGLLLGLAPADTAIILLYLPTHDGTVPIALVAGTCLVVRRLELLPPPPPGTLLARQSVYTASFDARTVPRAEDAVIGLVIDPIALLTPTELELTRIRALDADNRRLLTRAS